MHQTELAGILDNLVTQFASEYDCFRELVQNAIDAGSPRIELWSDLELSEGHVGVISLHVDDFGEGMTEKIIDEQFTQLFASRKEDDLTKIGKFGIGFVSVFAMNPKGVLVHTGRDGEYWEVFFHADRSFTKTRLDAPVEGTQITLFLEGDFHRYRDVVENVRGALKRWCAHSETEITFEDRHDPRSRVEVINEPFAVFGTAAVAHQEAGTQVVAAFSEAPIYGFYNRGLTLAYGEIAEQFFPGDIVPLVARVSVKVKSRYLEHTLSRDTIVRDDNWAKAMQAVKRALDELLPRELAGDIRSMHSADVWDLPRMREYATRMRFLTYLRDDTLRRFADTKLFRDVSGGWWTPAELHRAFRVDGRLLIADAPDAISKRLAAIGVPVVLGKRVVTEDWQSLAAHPLAEIPILLARFVTVLERERRAYSLWELIRSWFNAPDAATEVNAALTEPAQVYLPVIPDEEPAPAHAPLLARAKQLLQAVGAGYEQLGTFVPTTSERPPFFVTGRDFSSLMALPPRGQEQGSVAAVNRSHPHFARLCAQWEQRPELAAYCLAKCLLLSEDRLLGADLALMEAALQPGEV